MFTDLLSTGYLMGNFSCITCHNRVTQAFNMFTAIVYATVIRIVVYFQIDINRLFQNYSLGS